MQSPLAQQETIAESKGAPVPHAFAAGGLGLHDQRIGPYLQGRHRRHIHGSKELEQQGYLTRERIRLTNGRLGDIEYTIHEQPVTPDIPPNSPKRENPRQVNPEQAFPEQVKPEQENPAQLNTNRPKTEK